MIVDLKQMAPGQAHEDEINARNRLKVCCISLKEQTLKKARVYPGPLSKFPFER
jgi:hypothetical protein